MSERNQRGRSGLNRRRLLKAAGGVVAGVAALSGTASAHQSQFFGCSRVCTDTDGNYAVVAVDDTFECRPLETESDREDVPWDWGSYCYEAAEGEVIVGMLEEEVWVGNTRTEDGGCYLCVNPNACAEEHFYSPAAIIYHLYLNDTCGPCGDSITPKGNCRAYGAPGPDAPPWIWYQSDWRQND